MLTITTQSSIRAENRLIRDSLPSVACKPKYAAVPTKNTEAALTALYRGFKFLREHRDAEAAQAFAEARSKDPSGRYFFQPEALAHTTFYGESNYALLGPYHRRDRRTGARELDEYTDRQMSSAFDRGDYDACIKLDPDSIISVRLHGLQKLHQGNISDAVNSFKQYLKLSGVPTSQ